MKTFVLLLVFVALAASDDSYQQEYPASYKAPSPSYPAYSAPAYDYPVPYEFAYAVSDSYSGVSINQQEASNGGGATSGGYTVALPDGRTQIVTYKVDGESGFVADVRYEGEAKYPEYNYYPSQPYSKAYATEAPAAVYYNA